MPSPKEKTNSARKAAAKAVVRLHKGGWANLTVKTTMADPALSLRDRAFATAVFYGTAERMRTIDTLLAPFIKKPLEKLDVEVRAILETAIYQIKYMRVPQSAAVNEAVKLTRSFGKSSASGFVNAVLRKASAAQLPETFSSELERVCVTWSVGEAVAQAVMESLPGRYDAFFEASFGGGKTCLRANSFKTTVPELVEMLSKNGISAAAGTVVGSVMAELAGGVAQDKLFAQGMYHVQGLSSQYACACLQAQPGMRLLDVCAAPGGKTATLAQDIFAGIKPGGKLTAGEIRENRVPLIKELLNRLGIGEVDVILNDASVFNPDLSGQDRVLCDVPCSGLGVISSKPDLRYTNGDNFKELPALQLKILTTSSRYLNKGGKLVYSTCTVREQENADVVKEFLSRNPDFKLAEPVFLPDGALVNDKMVTILPNPMGWDGFFVATLERL